MAVRMFAAIEIGSFALELGIYEISEKTGIRCVDHIRHVIALGSDTFSEGKSATVWRMRCALFWRILRGS